MMIIGVDSHPSDQYIAFATTGTGQHDERRPFYGLCDLDEP